MDKKWRPGQRDGSKPYQKGRGRSFGHRDRPPSGPVDPSTAAEDTAEYILHVLAREHGEMTVQRESLSPAHFRLVVTCDPAATGRLIGKNGRTITALRSLVKSLAQRRNKRVDIDVN